MCSLKTDRGFEMIAAHKNDTPLLSPVSSHFIHPHPFFCQTTVSIHISFNIHKHHDRQ